MKPDEENGWTIPKAQQKADKGNIVHKSLELLARKKLAAQESKESFTEPEMGKTWPTDSFYTEDAFEEAWNHYTKKVATHWPWNKADYTQCKDWTNAALTMNHGRWNPLNRTIIQPEQYCDLIIKEPWARYSYPQEDGTKLDGYLGLKGTVDLITKVDGETLEYCDWKTGMRKDWASGKKKDWKALREDPQLRMYHYALSKLYPQYKYIIMTIVFIQDGGAFSLDFGPDDLPKTEKMLRDRFEIIRDCQRPHRIINNPYENWKCKRLCAAGMNEWKDSGKTVCDFIHGEILSLGLDRTTAKYLVKPHGEYGSGGGVENRGNKQERQAGQ
jgi:hypothetical protein